MQQKLPTYLNDEELLSLANQNVFIEGYQGLVKIDRKSVIGSGSKVRIGALVVGSSAIGEYSDIGLAGGAVIHASVIGRENIITNGAKIFHSRTAPGVRVYGAQLKNATVERESVLRPSATLQETALGERCKLKMTSSVTYSHVGDQVNIGSHSLIRRCTIGDQVHIGDYSKLIGAQIASGVRIGDYTHLKGNPDSMDIIVEKNVVIGSHVIIEAGSILYAGAKIPDYAVVFLREGRTVMSILKMD